MRKIPRKILDDYKMWEEESIVKAYGTALFHAKRQNAVWGIDINPQNQYTMREIIEQVEGAEWNDGSTKHPHDRKGFCRNVMGEIWKLCSSVGEAREAEKKEKETPPTYKDIEQSKKNFVKKVRTFRRYSF